MEQVDRAMQARVWQRVQGAAAPMNCREPLALAAELAAHYRELAGKSTGNTEQFRRLSRQLQATRKALLGLCRICGCPGEALPVSVQGETPRRRIGKCCHLERRLGDALEGLSGDPEWGRVCGRLAEDARARSILLLEILGTMKH